MKSLATTARQAIGDRLVQEIRQMILDEGYQMGDRLPSIGQLARRFGVGQTVLREALRKLQTLGAVTIRPGSGLHVGRNAGAVSRKQLLDLIDARIPVELKTVALAARHAQEEHFQVLRQLLAHAEANLHDADVLSPTNFAFHQQIALASGNAVLQQILHVLTDLFQGEQRLILGLHGFWQRDHAEHLGILEALEARDEELAVERMRMHLEGVREMLKEG